MTEIKVLVCDIDGTMIPYERNHVSTTLKKAILTAKENGLEFLIATGRHYSYIHPSLFSDLHPDYVVTINGACFNKADGTIIQMFPFNEKDVLALREIALANNIGLGFKFPNDIVSYANHDIFCTGYLAHKKEEFDALTEEFKHKILENNPEDDYHLKYGLPLGCFIIADEALIETIKPLFPHLVFSWSFTNGFDIFSKETTKARSIESFLNLKGFTWENVIVFGDAENDLDMIKKAKIGVAMGNAKENVKKEADFVTTSVHDDGIVNALQHFKLI
ncbi:MAG: Cof-type HAD-IIB family hydrolase [Anaerorhabdus sp.]